MSKIETEGLRLGESVRLASALEPVTALACLGGADGKWVLSWSAVDGAMSYEVNTTQAPTEAGSWAGGGRVTDAQWRCPVLEAGDLWVRVRAMSVTGAGPWSEPVFVKSRGASTQLAA